MKHVNYVDLKTTELETLRDNLLRAFYIYSNKEMKFTGYKDSNEYLKLIDAIKSTTGVELSSATLRDLIMLKHKGHFQEKTFSAIDKFISTFTKEKQSFRQELDINPIQQEVFWSINQGYNKPGIFINSLNGQFIGWEELKIELESKVISRCPRIIPVGSYVNLNNFYGRKNWVIWIFNKKDEQVGSVWLGGDPMNGWFQDGLVRIGKTYSDTNWEVYQIFQRYSDGSYRLVKSYV